MSATTQVCPSKADTPLPRHFHGRVYLDADILPSAIQRLLSTALIASVCLLSLAAFAPLLPDYWPALIVLLLAEFVCGLWCLRSLPARRLRLDHQGWSIAEAGGPLLPVIIEPEARLWPWCVILGFYYQNGRRVRLVILSDAMEPADYQRLRVWLVTQAGS